MEEKEKKKLSLMQIVSIVFGVLFILMAVVFVSDIPLQSILFALAGLVLIPSINEKVMNAFKSDDKMYKNTRIVFIIFAFILFFSSTGTNETVETNADSLIEENTVLNQTVLVENTVYENDVELENVINEQVLSLENTVNEKNLKIQELENTVTNTTTKVTELEDEVANKIAKITELEQSVNTLKEEKNTLESKISSQTTSSSTKSTTTSSSTKSTTSSSATTKSTTENNSYTVYITNTGSKYHRAGCSYLKSSNPISKSDAIAQGYSACSRCNP